MPIFNGENLWDDIGRKVGQQRHSSKAELLQDLKIHWSKISKSTLEALIESMLRRCAAVIKSKAMQLNINILSAC